jgi:hypothetical protein
VRNFEQNRRINNSAFMPSSFARRYVADEEEHMEVLEMRPVLLKSVIRAAAELTFVLCAVGSMAVAGSSQAMTSGEVTPEILSLQTLTKKELKALSKAHNPENQKKVAAYYHERALELTEKSHHFAAYAEYLQRQPMTVESKRGIACECPLHYNYFSKVYAQEAEKAEAQAMEHFQLAKKLSTVAAQN